METLTCQMKVHIQPFERTLALQELRALATGPIVPLDGDFSTASAFSIVHTSNADTMRAALAYWHSVGDEVDGLTTQLRREATHKIARAKSTSGELTQNIDELIPSNLPHRRSLRYATHGLHEYRGKFFPQLVRALFNIAQLPEGALILDPMAGSGTTLVEARLSNRNSCGLDVNPLAVFIARVKCQALEMTPTELSRACNELVKLVRQDQTSPDGRLKKSESLDETDQAYLSNWFHQQTIEELDHIEKAIRRMPTIPLQNFFLVALSNILRSVSLQKTEDLRIRREQKQVKETETINLFVEEAVRSTRTVSAFLSGRGTEQLGDYTIHEADAREAQHLLPSLPGNVDAVITSPPYATALPYIDTDRLNLIYLGLLPRQHHKTLDKMMIGNREVTTRDRADYWNFYEANRYSLPTTTRAMIERIDSLNRTSQVGFRRKNLSALLSRYFFDMRAVMQQTLALLRPGGKMFLVVGDNRTKAGDQHIVIHTPDHLAQIASDLGFRMSTTLSMEMLSPRSIFRKNAVPSERILSLEKPQ